MSREDERQEIAGTVGVRSGLATAEAGVSRADGTGVDLDERIPLVDLAWQHRQVAETIRQQWDEVVDSTSFVLGDRVGEFERAFGSFCGVRSCVGVGSGTDALEFALRGLDIAPGDEVIVPANSFIASASAVVRAGATPVLVDVDPVFLLIDPERAADRVTRKTAAVVAVHLFGQLAPMEELRGVMSPRVMLVEDAAQAHGAGRNGSRGRRFRRRGGYQLLPRQEPRGLWGCGGGLDER